MRRTRHVQQPPLPALRDLGRLVVEWLGVPWALLYAESASSWLSMLSRGEVPMYGEALVEEEEEGEGTKGMGEPWEEGEMGGEETRRHLWSWCSRGVPRCNSFEIET